MNRDEAPIRVGSLPRLLAAWGVPDPPGRVSAAALWAQVERRARGPATLPVRSYPEWSGRPVVHEPSLGVIGPPRAA